MDDFDTFLDKKDSENQIEVFDTFVHSLYSSWPGWHVLYIWRAHGVHVVTRTGIVEFWRHFDYDSARTITQGVTTNSQPFNSVEVYPKFGAGYCMKSLSNQLINPNRQLNLCQGNVCYYRIFWKPFLKIWDRKSLKKSTIHCSFSICYLQFLSLMTEG